ncbi:MAG: MFS transporter [Alphaproteobacteria bacterium]|nr:MFS transporter [Alphaproteobacteria bacterium]
MITQFLGALNDNLFKNALLTMVALKMSNQSDILSNVIAGLFILPFFLFSAWAGEFADKYRRDTIAKNLKFIEIVLMTGVLIAYYTSSLNLLILLMFLMGAQSAFFGPVKYALLPQQLKSEELITGNAYIEATTYIAILGGLIAGTLLPIEVSIFVLITLAVIGYFASSKILPAPAPRVELKINKNLFRAMGQNFKFLRKHKYILQSILGASWFWTIGALVAVQIYPLCAQVINADKGTITFFLVLFSVGVAVGSYACNKVLKGQINMIYVPLSALGMAMCLFGLWLASNNYPTAKNILSFMEFLTAPRAFMFSINLFMLAFFGGLYIIPLNAFMQNRAPKAYTASVIAGNNIINSFGMTFSAVFAILLFKLGFTLPQLFMIMGIISLMVAFYICSLLPDTLTRSLLQTVLRFMFRTKVTGYSNFKKAGSRVLIIANHTSLWDGVLMAAFMPERITFAITSAWTGKWFMPIIRLLVDFYPLDMLNPLSIRNLIEEIKKGRKVVVFPEGRISLTGKIMQVFDGAAMIASKANAKLLPVKISGAEYSTMSYVQDKFYTKTFPQIDIDIMSAQKFENSSSKNSRKVMAKQLYDLMIEMSVNTAPFNQSMFEALRKKAKINNKKHIIATDILGNTVSYNDLIVKSTAYGQALQKIVGDVQKIGLCMPSGLNFLVWFWAIQYLGKTAVILSENNLKEQITKSKVDVLLSLSDYENLSCENLNVSKIKPLRFAIGKIYKPNDVCVIMFKNQHMLQYSSKEILKSYHMLDCVLPFNTKDVAVNTLNSDVSDGFVLGFILPILSGIKSCFIPDMNAKLVSRIYYDLAATVLFSNEKTYTECAKYAASFDYFNTKLAFSIGQKADNETLDIWLKNFNVRILESYIPNDSALIATINTPLYYKFGSLGVSLIDNNQSLSELTFDEDGFAFK